jgi:hypothetical protein
VGGEPPEPGQGFVAAGAFFNRHSVVLEHEIAHKVAHGQQHKKTKG